MDPITAVAAATADASEVKPQWASNKKTEIIWGELRVKLLTLCLVL